MAVHSSFLVDKVKSGISATNLIPFGTSTLLYNILLSSIIDITRPPNNAGAILSG